jgi:hypothetical protein
VLGEDRLLVGFGAALIWLDAAETLPEIPPATKATPLVPLNFQDTMAPAQALMADTTDVAILLAELLLTAVGAGYRPGIPGRYPLGFGL